MALPLMLAADLWEGSMLAADNPRIYNSAKHFIPFCFQKDTFSSRRAKRAGWPKGQPACFGAGCYIEMATSYHQPHEYELVGG